MELQKCSVSRSRRLIDAMMVLEASSVEIALVIDNSERLVGTLTDGDIRRALLAGAILESPLEPYMQRHFTSVSPATERAEVLDLMRALMISQIPVVDARGQLVGLHLMREFVGDVPKENWAVVMAGGQGTRLRPITETLPKPMLRVAGRPILERVVLHLAGYGIRRIFLSVNYLRDVIERHFGDGSRFGCRIEYLREDSPLGTGGALSLLPDKPRLPLVVMNGDLITQADIGAMLEFHRSGNHKVTVGVRPYLHSVPFGCIETEGDRVIRQEEKPRIERTVNAGIYVLDPDLVERVPFNREFHLPALIDQCLALGESVRTYQIANDWIDVGHAAQLSEARRGGTTS